MSTRPSTLGIPSAGRAAPAALMIQGTGSDVGKSLIVAGLCRLFAREGMRVAPFKPQNMSNNAAVAAGGGEIGRAQALQARAAGIEPSVDMNPVLLKPESERGAQVVVQGRRWATLAARDYARRKPELMAPLLQSFARLGETAELILVEGAGSPAEINLRDGDIANMGFAEAAGLPVVIVGDIDRGGVIASLVGTHAVLDARDRDRIAGFIVNRFRGDPSLFRDGMAEIERRTGWHALGLVPYFPDALRLPAEDTVALSALPSSKGPIRVAVPRLPGIANFDDLDPLRLEPAIDLVMVEAGAAIPGDTRLVILTGSKSTIADLAALRRSGWDTDIAAHVRRGGGVIGLCGGYQILGKRIRDRSGLESTQTDATGLGLLDVETEFEPLKSTRRVEGRHPRSGNPISGYEIHLGRTEGPDRMRPVFEIGGEREGASSSDGRVFGTYVHGVFACDGFRRWLIGALGGEANAGFDYEAEIDLVLDRLADHLSRHLDCGRILTIAGNAHTRIAISP